MRRVRVFAMLAGVFLFGAIAVAQESQMKGETANPAAKAVVPRLIRFSGVLKDAAGKSHNGIIDVTFSLYREETSGEALWFETQTVEADAQGRYSVLLGAMHPEGLPMDLFTSGEARWLGVSVGRLPEQARVLLVAVPYALKAADADTLGGKPATAFVASDQLKEQVQSEVKAQVTESTSTTRTLVGTAPTPQVIAETSPATFTCATSGICVQSTQSGAGGIALRGAVGSATGTAGIFDNLGGGKILSGRTTGYAEKFYVDGSGNVWTRGAILANAYPATSGAAVFGVATAGSGATYGVRGQSASPSGVGAFGYATSPTGATYGLLGSNLSASGTGLSGSASSLTGNTIGVRAVVQSPNGTAAIFDNLGGGKLISARTTGYAEKFSVNASGGGYFLGNVGIGTNLPAHRLDVAGNLRINGLGNALIFPDGTVQTTAGSGGGGGTITGVTAGTGLSGGGTAGNVTLSLASASCSAGQAAVALPLSCQPFATLGGNTFTGTQAVTGNVTASGSVTAASFSGNGSGLTSLAGAYVTGPVASATTATTATNALALGGVAASGYATVGPNSFVGDQSFTGNLTLTGTLNGLCIISSKTWGTSLSANMLLGFTGLSGGGVCAPLASSASAMESVVLPGGNTITDGVIGGTISGGGGIKEGNPWPNSVSNNWGTVGGGAYNRAGDGGGPTSPNCCQVVAGGLDNKATIGGATVSGGWSNSATSYHATVPGGVGNTANGWFSFAGGCFATAANDGAFVWSGSTGAGTGNCTSLTSSASGQFLALAPGGVKFFSNTALTAGVSLAAGGGSWSSVSDRNAKENFQAADGEALLARLHAIPILTWNYKSQDSSIRHMGPIAQDFRAAFGLGEDDKHISTVDADGVALAGVQALYRMEVEKDREIRSLRNEIARLEARQKQVEELTRQVTELRALVERLAAERLTVASVRR